MKALRFFAREDVRLVDIAEPVCGPEEVKIKVKNCSTCGTDVKILHNGHVNITRITTVASGRCTSAPAPRLNAIGRKPSEATSAVIRTGRRRPSAPSRIASSRRSPCAHSLRMNAIITTPLSTATPESAMNPTPAEIDKGRSRSHSASTPPVNAKGTPLNTTTASRADPNTMNSRPKIITKVIGTTTPRRSPAAISCSKVPP